MTREVRFLFDRRFDPGTGQARVSSEAPAAGETPDGGAAPESDPVATEPEPHFTQDDMDRACAEARAAGRSEGAATAVDATTRRTAETLNAIAEGVQNLVSGEHGAHRERTREASVLARAMVAKLFPELNRRHGFDEIVGMVEAVSSGLTDTRALTIRVSEGMAEPVRRHLAAKVRVRDFEGESRVVGDPGLADGDCRIDWRGGGAVRDSEQLRRSIDALCHEVLGSPAGAMTADRDDAHVTAEPAPPPVPSQSEPGRHHTAVTSVHKPPAGELP
ncbi:MAG: hypothetical protein EA406_11465 [Rhodospirillales bacterium]|nr:MAG: hypothetical protein EA406_11465 [Rhodospirillales bacterium]